ncbi:helix-turn-helix domain-containing protein [Nitrososphaera viennensis]|uniref:HTH arsR-type domain-containing protein n=2 Tax=Nitrososphaera viennensis TaxID=1034015 RepID=A0A060HIZ6_9ARCH|nr:helix-turn-helix domain-containing protein [Nitrososphaera viennensis]AIC15493.1 hypothetical protein NVIE_012600 [Nitrososphaera viennensis EN76]UVS70381.1 helix-turn-helix domain-containing protein [Nitrososphaera viennensis]
MFLTAGISGIIGLITITFRLPSSFLLRASPGSGPAGQGGGYIDPRFKRVLWYLIASSRGGVNRAKIIDMLNGRPANANQIASELKLDYKTVLHHLKVLTENGMIITENKEMYGATYFLTPLMEKNYASFQEILARVKKG